mmetsp:Transcript_20540/g.50396  ORF Transcript_20540/g.50396 Transcript_20540/m.50396 type:complete len:313 (-) Transcript_20540:133-1071(-)
MPCNHRNQQHRAFGCHPAWRQANFPESLIAAFLEEHHDAALHPAWENQNKARRTSSSDDEAHVLRMDVPGVKADRISIEEKNGEIEITALRMNGEEQVAKVYQEVFYLNPFRFDIDQAKATLTNGVLTLRIPKNEASMKMVSVESASVPSDLPSSNIFQHTLDLPGVPASSLEVKLVEDRVHLVGKRSLGDNKRVLVQRSFEVPPSMDTLQARALLQDGVFTFLAPIHETEEGELRTIFVQEAMEVESAAMADMKISDEENNNNDNSASDSKTKEDEPMKEDDTANVETVDEDAEAKETDSWVGVPSEEAKN